MLFIALGVHPAVTLLVLPGAFSETAQRDRERDRAGIFEI